MEMKEGEARKLIIPADLGYGSKGAGGKIPGGATLYFEVKLAALGDAPVLNEKQQRGSTSILYNYQLYLANWRSFAVMPPDSNRAEPGMLWPRARARCRCGTPSANAAPPPRFSRNLCPYRTCPPRPLARLNPQLHTQLCTTGRLP